MDKVALRIGSEKEKNLKKIKNLKMEIAKILTINYRKEYFAERGDSEK